MIAIYGKDNCKWCHAAQVLCDKAGLPFVYVPVDDHGSKLSITGSQLIDICPVPISTVPQIFDGGRYVGGFEDFKTLLANTAQTR